MKSIMSTVIKHQRSFVLNKIFSSCNCIGINVQNCLTLTGSWTASAMTIFALSMRQASVATAYTNLIEDPQLYQRKRIKMIINLKKMTDYSLTFVIPSCQSTYIRRFSSCFDRLACWKFRRHRGNARASSFTFDTEWG